MSSTLLIRHLSGDLDVSEKEDFLKYFGAQKVWFINKNSHTAFASFVSNEAAEEALHRLHQLEVLGKRLVVEFAKDKNVQLTTDIGNTSEDTNVEAFKQFINKLNATNSFLNFYQPPPPDLKYKYPPASSHILINMLYSLAKNIEFYTQTLHTMNKMSLDPPFDGINDDAKIFLRQCLEDVGLKLSENYSNDVNNSSSEESEISCEESNETHIEVKVVKPIKRKPKIKTNIIKKLRLSTVPSTTRKPIDKKEVFEDNSIAKQKKIEINVNSLPTLPLDDVAEVIGTIGKIDPRPCEQKDSIQSENAVKKNEQLITSKEILSNKISKEDMKILPVFKNYQPGTPSMRLYIKNLSKGVTSEDIENIFRHYITEENSEEATIFDVRVMQEGRMKGQAFVTLPNLKISQKALEETNGFIFKDKPMVVQFARTANK